MALVFTGDEFADGGDIICQALKMRRMKASFFLTGRFYGNPAHRGLIKKLKEQGHYLGSHSDQHLLYCDWKNRDSLLVSENEFKSDLTEAYAKMRKFGIRKKDAGYFLPPYEWYNKEIATWTAREGLQLINFTPGTRSAADYTYPEMGRSYTPSNVIYQSVLDFEEKNQDRLNGFILLFHVGTDRRREDKFYSSLGLLLDELKNRGYKFLTVEELLR